MISVWDDGDECIIVTDHGHDDGHYGTLDLNIDDVIELYEKLGEVVDKRRWTV